VLLRLPVSVAVDSNAHPVCCFLVCLLFISLQGGWFVTHLASRDEVCAVTSCHPSLMACKFAYVGRLYSLASFVPHHLWIEKLVNCCCVCCVCSGEDRAELCSEMRSPTMMLAAGNDADDVKANGLMNTSLLDSGIDANDIFFKEYAAMKHGWVNRGDLNDKRTAADVEDALKNVERFMAKYLK